MATSEEKAMRLASELATAAAAEHDARRRSRDARYAYEVSVCGIARTRGERKRAQKEFVREVAPTLLMRFWKWLKTA